MTIHYSLADIASKIQCELLGEDITVSGVASLQQATAEHITFLANEAYEQQVSQSNAGAVILHYDKKELFAGNRLLSRDPYVSFALLTQLFQAPPPRKTGIHSSATVARSAKIADSAFIGPGCVIGDHCEVGAEVVITANCYLGEGVRIGASSHLFANVTLYDNCVLGANNIIHSGVVIGSDGFGFANDGGKWQKIAQLGHVVLGDDVEVGANTTIDCGAIDNTVIGNGVKIDNQVQIAHNVTIGDNSVIAGCVGIAGSTTIGKNCMLGGAAAIGGHLQLVDNVVVTGMGMVTHSLKKPGLYSSGTGIDNNERWRKNVACFRRLEKDRKKMQKLYASLEEN